MVNSDSIWVVETPPKDLGNYTRYDYENFPDVDIRKGARNDKIT